MTGTNETGTVAGVDGEGSGVAMHAPIGRPSDWVRRFAALIEPGGSVLDLACGGGRHARWLADAGFRVVGVDRDPVALGMLDRVAGVDTLLADLETDTWPLEGRRFDAVIVTNYLYRPHFDALLRLVRDGGVLIYETFMAGNERFGRPRNPDFLLMPGELPERLRGVFSVIAFEQGEITRPARAVVQRVAAVRTPDAIVVLPDAFDQALNDGV